MVINGVIATTRYMENVSTPSPPTSFCPSPDRTSETWRGQYAFEMSAKLLGTPCASRRSPAHVRRNTPLPVAAESALRQLLVSLGGRGDRSCRVARKLACFPLRFLLRGCCIFHCEIQPLVGLPLQLIIAVRHTVRALNRVIARIGKHLFCSQFFFVASYQG